MLGPRHTTESKHLRVFNNSRARVLGERVRVADSSITRFVGLLGRTGLSPSEGLLIRPSNGVHTLGMLFTIDVLLIDKAGVILTLYHSLRPFRITRLNWKSAAALEFPSGILKQTGTEPGDQLILEPATL
jgi:uncharacterized membrane protein (UPF0127 family)